MFDLIRGIGVPPALVGIARGVIEAAVVSALAALVVLIPEADIPETARVWAPVVLMVVRIIEGIADGIDPSKSRSA